MRGDEHLFIENVDISRIVCHTDCQDIISYLQNNIETICNHPNLRELLLIRNPKLGELRLLKPLIQQICDSILIGNNFAAVALTNMLFEATFKFFLVYMERTRNESLDKMFVESLQRYEDKELRQLINYCKSKGYITKDDCKRLTRLSILFRNAFSHASFSHSGEVEGKSQGEMHLMSITTLEHQGVISFDIDSIPFIYMMRCSKYVDSNAFGYFATIMHFVDKFDQMITTSINAK